MGYLPREAGEDKLQLTPQPRTPRHGDIQGHAVGTEDCGLSVRVTAASLAWWYHKNTLGLLGGGNPAPIKIAPAAQRCLEFTTQRIKRATIQGHQAQSPTTAALKKTRKKKCSSNSLGMWLETLGRLPHRAGQSVGRELTSFSQLPEAKKAQTEDYQLRSSIKLIINETLQRKTVNE